MPNNMIIRLGVDASDFQKKMKQAGVLSAATGAKIKNALTANGLSGVREIVAEMESARETILSSTAGMDISQPLSEQIKQVMADRDKILAEQSKVSKRLAEVQAMPVANTELSIARKQAKIRLLKEEVSGLRAAYASVSDQLSSLQSVASSIGPEFMRFASHTGLQQMDIEINHLKQALEDVASIGDEVRQAEAPVSKFSRSLRRIGDSAGSSNGRLERMVRTIRNVSVVSFGLRIVRGMFGELGTVVRNYIRQDAQLQAQVNGLSASMGNVLAPAIRLVSGSLSYVLPYVVGVSNAIGQLMGALFGTGWTAGASGANKMAAATGGAAKAQKELNRQLMSFDQINKVDGQKDSGAAGGGGGAGSALEEIVGKTPAWMERFKASFTELFNSSEFQAANIGGKLGMVLQTGLDWLGGEGMRFDWRGVGTKLRENFNSFMSSGWLSSFFYDIGVGIGGLSEFISGLLDEDIDWGNMYETFTTTVLSPLMSGLADFFKEKGNESAASFWEGLEQGVSEKASTEVGGLALLPIMPIIEARKDLKDQMNKTGKYSMEGFGEGMSNEVTAKDWKKFFNDLVDGVKDILGIHSPSTVFAEIGENCMSGLGNGFTKGLAWIQEKLDDLKNRVMNASQTLKEAFSFDWQLPHLRLPHLSVQWDPVDNVLARFFGVTAFPRLNVDWYAKGFITNGTSILNGIGIGERGREALLPLDSNDGWKREIAQEIAMILQGNNGGDVNAIINIILDSEKIDSFIIKRLRQRARAGITIF